jgi:hypothetical protein
MIERRTEDRSTHEVERKLDFIISLLEKIMASLDQTLAVVTTASTVDDSIIALLQGLNAQITAGGLSPADQAKVDAIFSQATANNTKITAAVLANTPTPVPNPNPYPVPNPNPTPYPQPTVLAFATANPLPSGTSGTPYSGAFSANGGTPPYTFSGTASPASLSIASDGTLSGAPSPAGSYSFSVTVTDSAIPKASASATFSLTVN